MAMLNKWSRSDREARSIMEDAARHSKGSQSGEGSDEDQPKVEGYRLRGKLYDRIHVSLKTMDIIVAVTAVLLLAAIIVGIATGNRG